MEGICTRSSVSPSPTSLSNNTKQPKLDPQAAVREDPLTQGPVPLRTWAMAGQPSVHVKAAPPLSEAPSPVASLWSCLSKYRLPGASPETRFSPTAQQQLGVRLPSRQHVIFVPFKIYFAYFCGLPCHQIRTLIIFNTFILVAFWSRDSGFVSIL